MKNGFILKNTNHGFSDMKHVFHAHCKVFKYDIHLSSMRLGAIESHNKGKRYLSRQVASTFNTNSIKSYLKKTASPINSETTSSTSSVEQPYAINMLSSSSNTMLTSTIITSPSSKIVLPSITNLNPFTTAEQCTKAEIIWTLPTTVNHHSHNSNQSVTSIFKTMFPDSEIAKKITCGRQKPVTL